MQISSSQSKIALIEAVVLFVFSGILFANLSGCNRSGRVPDASTELPRTLSGYIATNQYPLKIAVMTPSDSRTRHQGESVAGTFLKDCRSDSLWGDQARLGIKERIIKEFKVSNLFKKVYADNLKSSDLILTSDIHAFCSDVKAVNAGRAAGIVAIDFTLKRESDILYKRKIERIVTDADSEYTGSQAVLNEQAMRHTMADSLREVIKILLIDLDANLEKTLGS